MIDPIITLALAINSAPGAYALLLGSGVSRTAGVLTGYDVVTELIRRVAALQGQEEKAALNPRAWFHGTYGRDTSYAELLEQLTTTATERAHLLRSFFEPNEEEREEGRKQPTRAHHAIARLVAEKSIRVILTTNFDLLMERALARVGINPVVIATPASIAGAPPLHQSPCTIIKLNGDYTTWDLRNIRSELAAYDTGMSDLLLRVLEEYGLVVCGWSADYDTALREALLGSRVSRYGTYWASRHDLGMEAARVVAHRGAVVLTIRDADTHFESLEQKLRSLQSMGARHPLATPLAVAQMKRALPRTDGALQLHDLMMAEVEEVVRAHATSGFSTSEPEPTPRAVIERMSTYETLMETCMYLGAVGVYWGKEEHQLTWRVALERLLNHRAGVEGGYEAWCNLRSYPALLLLYAAGLAGVVAGKYDVLRTLLFDTQLRRDHEENNGLASLRTQRIVPEEGVRSAIEGQTGQRLVWAGSHHLREVLRGPLRELCRDDVTYDMAFDRFEYVLALTQAVHLEGRFTWGEWCWFANRGYTNDPRDITRRTSDEIERTAGEWPPMMAGLFGRDWAKFTAAKAAVDDTVKRGRRG